MPGRPATGQENATTAHRRTPPGEQALLLTIVKDEETRQRVLPGGEHQLHLFKQT